MPEILEFTITLRFFGDDLDPDEVSKSLGTNPSFACKKGEVTAGTSTRKERLQKTGKWLLYSPNRTNQGLEPQVAALLEDLTQDLSVWQNLTKKLSADVNCGVWLHSSNEGTELSPNLMRKLGERGLLLGLDVYEQGDDSLEQRMP